MWLVLVLLAGALGDLTSCEAGLQKVLARFLTVVPNDTYSEMAVYSGKWIGDLGNYFDCIDIKEANYALFTVSVSGAQLIYSLCGPANCTVEDYQQLLGGLATTPEVLSLAANLKGAKPGLLVKKGLAANPEISLEVVFPQHYIHEHFSKLNAGAIVMVVLCSCLALILLVGTAIDMNRQFTATIKANIEKSSEDYIQMSEMPAEKLRPQVKPSFVTELLVCFSVYTNFKKLFASRSAEKSGVPKDTLDILNGVRVLSIGWVILGHVYLLRLDFGPIKNQNDLPDEFKKVKTAMIYGALFAVDTFFWLSGLLMAYLLLIQFDSPKGIRGKAWGYLYFHRLYRILPAYMFVLFLCWAFTKYLGNGPMWVNGDQFNNECHDWWWTNLIFLNNFLPDYKSNNCLGQSWYLANDMQFFWISPPVFYIYYKVSQKLGWVLLNVGVVLAIVSSAAISSKEDCNVVLIAPTAQEMNDDIYVKPYCRVAPYALGIMCGLVLYTQRNHAKTGKVYDVWAHAIGNLFHKRYFRYGGYLLGLFFINFFIFIQYTAYKDVDNGWTSWSHSETAAFYGFQRPCWGLGISLLFLPMLLGHWKLVAWFLSLDIWTPLARLTFCTYLVHIHLGMVFFQSLNEAYWFNDLNITIDFFFITFISFAAAIPLTLAVESPFMAMEKLFKGKRH